MSKHLEYHLKAFLKQIVDVDIEDDQKEEKTANKLDFATYLENYIVKKRILQQK